MSDPLADSQDYCFYHDNHLPGWKCDNPTQCFGRNGEQVLTSLGKHYGGNYLLSGENRTGRDLGILFSILACLLGAILTVHHLRCTEHRQLVLPKDPTLRARPNTREKMKKSDEQPHVPNSDDEYLRVYIPKELDESTLLMKPSANVLHSANVLAFESLEFEVETNINSTTVHQSILQGVSGSARSGEPLCVLGPSGAGKTTFLKVITLAADEGAVSGQVTLNGHLMDAAIRSKHCCMVGQDETTWSHLSCWESLWFAAGLYVVGDEQTKLERCNHCMQKMGLESCKDVMVGDQFRTGLSGGERKRLLVAMALLKNPSVLFLDEPTSGLDAAAAAHTMEYMLGLARSEQLILVATIHQPSSCTFSSFGDILLLSQGRVAYHGQACDAVEYFEKLGYVAPAQLSTPEWLLELVNPDFSQKSKLSEKEQSVKSILSEWTLLRPTCSDEPHALPLTECVGFMKQFLPVFYMVAKLVLTHPVYHGKFGFALLISLLFGVLLSDYDQSEQDIIVSRTRAISWMTIGCCQITSMITVLSGFNANNMIIAQSKNGMGSPSVYCIAFALADLLMLLPQVCIHVLICFYMAFGAPWEAFGSTYLCILLCSLCCEACARSLSTASSLPVAFGLFYSFFWNQFLFSGITIGTDSVRPMLCVLCLNLIE